MAERKNRLLIPVRFLVRADSLEEGRDKIRQLIEHGKAMHNGDVDWEWAAAAR
jgi:hypothetical protein